MSYIKKFAKVLLYPIILILGEFMSQYIFVYLFNQHQLRLLSQKYSSLNKAELIDKLNIIIKTQKYKSELMTYINDYALIIVFLTLLLLLPLFYNILKKYKSDKQNQLLKQDLIIIGLIGICVSASYNLTVSSLNNIWHFTNNYHLSTVPVIIQIITSGIAGPVLEEMVFRGIVYNKLKEFNKPKQSVIITSIIFAIWHISNPLNVIYAFIISLILIYVYDRYNNICAPICLHIFANTATILLMSLIVQKMIILNIIITVICVLILLYVLGHCFGHNLFNKEVKS